MTDQTSALFAPLVGKGFIQIDGEEAARFLQTILTANIDQIAVGGCAPAALLTPQGRVLHDMMIYRCPAGADLGSHFIIEADASGLADLFKHLRRYRLRRPVNLRVVEDMTIWLCWGAPVDSRRFIMTSVTRASVVVGLAMVIRHPPFTAIATRGEITQWQALRIAAGVPEGPLDLTPERALMLEAGLDRLGAVDFEKGCYIGQEVTARTHYRGLVKRRLVPLHMPAGSPPAPGTEILLNERAVATTKTAAKTEGGSLCLALIKLSDLHLVLGGEAKFQVAGSPADLLIPEWMQPLPNPARTDRLARRGTQPLSALPKSAAASALTPALLARIRSTLLISAFMAVM
jgi:folate-binding protein YgfZ